MEKNKLTNKNIFENKKLKYLRRKIRYSFLYFLAVGAGKASILLPESWVYGVCEYIACFVFYFSKRERKKTIKHITMAYKNSLSDKQIKEIAKNTFINLGRNLAELILWDTFTAEKIKKRVEILGLEHIERALKKNRGAIILTCHCGNFELIAATVVAYGYKGTAIARAFHDRQINKLLNDLRRSKGCDVIDRSESPRKIFNVLKKNELIGMLADQDIRKINGVFVDFFGMPAYTPTAPVQLALTAKSPILPVFIIRDKSCKYNHHIIINPPLNLIDDRKNPKAIIENTQRWSKIVENHIRKYPDQWVWMHKRWKTTPEKLKRKNNEKNDRSNCRRS